MTPTSAIEYLIWLLLAAAVLAIVSKRLHLPYTVALVLGGLVLGTAHLPIFSLLPLNNRPDWLTPDVILILFLPALVFEGSVKLDLRLILRNSLPLLLLANAGMLLAAVVTGLTVHWLIGLPMVISLLFGSIISATDPISVLAIFKDLKVNHRLSLILEGESLLNDGTAVVLFEILLAAVLSQRPSIAAGIGHYLLAVGGGAFLGSLLGYVASRITETVDDPQVEITLTTILAYGSYLLAHHLHFSGVIATACAGLMIGNVGAKRHVTTGTLSSMQSFWEYVSFVMNSMVFLLIGLEINLRGMLESWIFILLAIAAVLAGRALSVYIFVAVSNLFTEKIALSWQHLFVWCGLRGALALALALSLGSDFPYRDQILSLTFGVVIFSIIVQGLTIKPLVKILKLSEQNSGRH